MCLISVKLLTHAFVLVRHGINTGKIRSHKRSTNIVWGACDLLGHSDWFQTLVSRYILAYFNYGFYRTCQCPASKRAKMSL